MNYQEWKEFVKKPGSKSTIMEMAWLKKGCPLCETVRWELTNDGWAYCRGCNAGWPTYAIWANTPLEYYDENGYHCFMCEGYGKRDGELCEECNGFCSQPASSLTQRGADREAAPRNSNPGAV
jgi:hypothetical protein